jgi:Glycogen recognition site of AMP-activated protein kinase
MERPAMKISNWLRPPKLTAKISRLDPVLRLMPAGQTTDVVNKLSPDSARLEKNNRQTVRGKIQNFSYDSPTAQRVQLVGDFTNWQEQPINLQKRSNGMWLTALRLQRGTHYYRFLVDGQWCDDPECFLFVPNPFGSLNAVRHVA